MTRSAPRPADLTDAGLLDPSAPRADGATLAVMFVIALLMIPASLVISGIPLSLTPGDVVALGIGLCWLCAQFTTTLGVAKGHSPVRTAVFIYFVTTLASYGYAASGYLPADEIKLGDHGVVLIAAMVAIALGVCDGVRGRERLDLVLKIVAVFGAVVAMIGILQFLMGLDLTKYLALPGLHARADEPMVQERGSVRRVAGTAEHPIEFGVLCAMLLPICAHYSFQAGRRGRPAWPWWLGTALVAAGLMFSVSRSAVLSFAATAVVLLAGWPAKWRVAALGACAGFLVALKIAVPGLMGTFYDLFVNSGHDDSVRYRVHDYDAAAAEMSKHLWLGHGPGTWYAPKHQVFDNQYLLTLVEAGVVGVAAFATLLIVAAFAAFRARYLSTDPDVRNLGLTLGACLFVPLIGSSTFDLLSFHTVTGLTFLLIGAAASLLRIVKQEQRTAVPP
jgi:O-antigen ligase